MGAEYSAVIEAIEKLAPPFLQAPWDCSGLQVASTRRAISKLAVCLDAVPQLVEKALADGFDFILAHHPLALKARLPNKLDAYRRVLQLLLETDTPLYSAHTSLDVNINGPAGFLGRELKLENTEILDPLPDKPEYGYGQIGDLPDAISFSKLAAKVMEILRLDVLPVCGLKKKDIARRAAYCGGSGSSLLEKAREMGADVFITGDVKYHAALEAAVPVLDAGHFSVESGMMRGAALCLQEALPDVEVSFLSSPDPFSFIYRA